MTDRLNATQISNLNNMCFSASGSSLGTRLDEMAYGSVPSTFAYGTIASAPIVKYSLTPAIGSATKVKAAIALTSGAQAGVTSGITQPDFPRLLSAKGNASGITGNVVIHGTNAAGEVISDTIALNGSSEVAGVKAFATVTSIDYPAETHSGTDTVSIGAGNKFGFPVAIPNDAMCLVKNFDGSADAGTVTAASTVEGSFYAPAGTVNGVKILALYFVK